MVPVRSKLSEDVPPFVLRQSGPPAKTEVKFKASPNPFASPLSHESPQQHKVECRSDTPLNPFHTPSPKPPVVSGRTEPRTYDSPFSAFTLTLPGPSQTPAIEERHSSWPVNPFLSPVLKSEVEIAPTSPSEKALQEIIKFQAKQTELSAFMAQQQQVSSLPVQEAPTFSGNYFDCSRNIAFVTTSQTKEETCPKKEKMMFEGDFSEKHRNSQALSQEDRRFLTIVEKGIRHCEDGHYELPLPLKESSPSLSNNQEVALRRSSQLKRRFQSDQKYKEDYTSFMESLIKNGHAERVPPEECLLKASSQNIKSSLSSQGKVRCIPDHGIYHPKKLKQDPGGFRLLGRIQERDLK